MKKLSWIHLFTGAVIAVCVFRFWSLIKKPFAAIVLFFSSDISQASGKQWLALLVCIVLALVILVFIGGYILMLIMALFEDLRKK